MPDDFVASAIADIAADLFPKRETPTNDPVPGAAEGGEAPPIVEKTEEPPPPLPQGKSLPKSWKKEMEAHWLKLDPAVHDYVYEREANVDRGIQMYSEGHKKWDALTTPFKDLMAQNPNSDPIPLLQNLLSNHITLLRGTPEQKVEIAKNLIASYGLDLTSLTGTQPPQADPRLEAALRKIDQLETNFSATQRASYEAGVAEQVKAVEAFEKENEFFSEVADDIHRFIQTGAAPDLKSAYELACYANPAVRAKILAKQQAAPSPAPQQKQAIPNIDGSGQARVRTPTPKTIEDTVDSIVAKHYPTH